MLCRVRAAGATGRAAFKDSWSGVDALLRTRRLEILSALQPLAEIQVHSVMRQQAPATLSSHCMSRTLHCSLPEGPGEACRRFWTCGRTAAPCAWPM